MQRKIIPREALTSIVNLRQSHLEETITESINRDGHKHRMSVQTTSYKSMSGILGLGARGGAFSRHYHIGPQMRHDCKIIARLVFGILDEWT